MANNPIQGWNVEGQEYSSVPNTPLQNLQGMFGNLGGLISQGAGTIGSIFSTLFTNAQNRKLANKQMQWSHDEAQLNRDFQVSEREATQEYNSPIAQVNRMREAGLNPLQGTQGVSQAQPMTGSQASGYQRAEMMNPIEGLLMKKQIESIDMDNALKREEVRGKEIENDANDGSLKRQKSAEAELAEILASNTQRQMDDEHFLKSEEVKNIQKTMELTDEQILNARETFKYIQSQTKALDDTTKANVALTYAQANESKARVESMDWQNAKVVTMSYAQAKSKGATMSSSVGEGLSKNASAFPYSIGASKNSSSSKSEGNTESISDSAQVSVLIVRDRKTGKDTYTILSVAPDKDNPNKLYAMRSNDLYKWTSNPTN